jgi:2'-5' RNA ligase
VALPERIRCFVAVLLDEPIRRRLSRVRDEVVAGFRGVRPVSDASMHLTLKFLGEIPRGDVARAMRLVQEAAAGAEMLESEVGGLGAFPPGGRPRVVWAGMSDPDGTLARLHRRLDVDLKELGVRGDGRRYTPHVTLARVRDRRGAFGLRERLREVSADGLGVQLIEEIALMMSELRPEGAHYSELGRAPLA